MEGAVPFKFLPVRVIAAVAPRESAQLWLTHPPLHANIGSIRAASRSVGLHVGYICRRITLSGGYAAHFVQKGAKIKSRIKI